uniref:RBR-type E3 ubiquitin transferase n=1 Tax=Eptatretus burgeri TaxID=7764 RepID=A0A8C4Q4E0_EPTBU
MVLSDERSSEDESESEACLFAGKQEVYEGLRIQDLQELKDQIIVQTADMLQVPLFTAEALLRSRGWDREHLLEAWMTDSVACCQRAGVQLPPPPPSGQNSWGTIPDLSPMNSPMTPPGEFDDGLNQTCEICFGWLPRLCGLVDIPCGHCFCRACWEAYLNVKIKEGETDNILCPAYNCYQLVPVEVIEGLISREMARRYLQFDIKAFVESNPTIRWCPVPGCDRAVQLSGPTTNMAGILPSQLLRAPAVDCGNGHTFCWECLGEAHEPCDCGTWRNWLKKITDMKPEELHGVTVAAEDAANCLWLITNCKTCPNCKTPIQKNDGCNHMQCTKCKHDFCWICLEEWKKHSSSTGGYYRCTRYEVIQQVEEQSREIVEEAEKKHKKYQELDRFIHYYTRFKNHENNFKLEQPLLHSAKAKMEILRCALNTAQKVDTTFIEDAVMELLRTRRVLRGSYGYGFFLEPNSTQKEIFEMMQTELEMVTEDLAQKVNRPYLRTPRRKIIRAACLVQQKRKEFIASVARGVAPPDSPPSSLRRLNGAPWEWEFLGFSSAEEYEEVLDQRWRQRRRELLGAHGRSLAATSHESGMTDPLQAIMRRRRMESHDTLNVPQRLMLTDYTVQDLPFRRRPRHHHLLEEEEEVEEDGDEEEEGEEEEDPDVLLAIQLSLQEFEPIPASESCRTLDTGSLATASGTGTLATPSLFSSSRDGCPEEPSSLSSSFTSAAPPWFEGISMGLPNLSTPEGFERHGMSDGLQRCGSCPIAEVCGEQTLEAVTLTEENKVRTQIPTLEDEAEGRLKRSRPFTLSYEYSQAELNNVFAFLSDFHPQNFTTIPCLGPPGNGKGRTGADAGHSSLGIEAVESHGAGKSENSKPCADAEKSQKADGLAMPIAEQVPAFYCSDEDQSINLADANEQEEHV